MNMRGTTVLGAFAIALAAYTVWDYKKAQDSLGTGVDEKKLFSLTPGDVEKIKVVHAGETIVIEKQNGDWQIREPLQDLAASTAVDALIYSLLIQKGRNFRTEDTAKTAPLAEYGLDKTAAVEEIKGKGKTESLSVSNKNAFDGSYYVSQGSEVFLGDRGLAQVLAKDVKSLRSRKPWPYGDMDVESVEISLPDLKEKYIAKVAGGKWTLDPAPKFSVDGDRIEQWVEKLLSATATEIAADNPTADEKRNFLLLKPGFTAHVKYKKQDGTPSEWTFTAGQDRAEDVFVYSTSRDTVYKFNRSGLKGLRVPREYFRDGRSAFKFPLEKAAEIEIRQDSFHHKFKKEGADWKIDGAGSDLVLNQEKLVELMQRISRIEAQEFFPAKEAKGFKNFEGITIRDAQGGELFKLTWGDEYKGKRSFNEAMTFRAIRTNLESDAMGIDAAKFKTLVDPGLVLKREKK